jgi:hypothetical protein
MVSIMVFVKLLVEPKTLGWENSRKSFENGFENLGIVSTPLKCFLNDFGTNGNWDMEGKELVVLEKGIGVSLLSLEAINPCNHITPVWDGA